MMINALSLTVPILLAAIGGTLSERSGMLNIGLEGLILTGAFGAVAVTNATGSILLGLLGGAASGLLLSALYSVVCLELRANIFVAGLAINLLAAGLIPFLSELLFGTRGVVRLATESRIPRIGGVSGMLPVAVGIAIVSAVALYRTPWGIRLRAAGGTIDSLAARGLNSQRYMRTAALISGVLAGLGGAEIALRLGVYLPNISAGRGWIALVAIFLGLRNPIGVIGAAFVFAFFEAFAGAAQGFTEIPGTLLLGLPYLVTVVAMVIYSAIGRRTRIERDARAE
jgi:simple sugar transport system permease protein